MRAVAFYPVGAFTLALLEALPGPEAKSSSIILCPCLCPCPDHSLSTSFTKTKLRLRFVTVQHLDTHPVSQDTHRTMGNTMTAGESRRGGGRRYAWWLGGRGRGGEAVGVGPSLGEGM